MAQMILAALERLVTWAAGIALSAMMLLTFVDVIGRYWYNRSIFGASEMIELLMVVTVFGGLALVARHDEHITVSLFDGWLDRWAPAAQRLAIRLCGLLCQGLIAWVLAAAALRALATGRQTIVLGLPQWLYPASAALLSGIGVTLLAVWLLGQGRGAGK
jgi:TRAP-type transport system small permease protein